MKSSKSYIPNSDAAFLRYTNTFMKELGLSLARFGFPQEEYDELTLLHTDFVQKLEIAETPATRTKVTIQEKNEARHLLEKKLRQSTSEYLTHNHRVTDADRDSLGLPIHKTTHTPAPVATTYPDFDVDSSTIRRLTIDYYDAGSKKSRAKPEGQHGAEIRWAISDAPVVDIDDLAHSSFDTRTPFTLEFQGHERGKTVYFCLRWENTRGEKGPWSEIVSAIIP